MLVNYRGTEATGSLLHLNERREPRLNRFVTVDDVQQFLLEDEGWESRYDDDWTRQQWAELLVLCDGIRSDPRWAELAASGLESEDLQEFWWADRTARALGIDTFPAQLRRLERDRLHGNWWTVMQLADDSRIDRIVELAERVLPLDEVATGPGESIGMTPEFAADSALNFILQDLGRFQAAAGRLSAPHCAVASSARARWQ